jgi:hypothetical protein
MARSNPEIASDLTENVVFLMKRGVCGQWRKYIENQGRK